MRSSRGQALVELAVCAPILVLLALGVAAVVQVQDAAAGLDAATHTAAAAAVSAPDPMTADAAARARFAAVVEDYPLHDAVLHVSLGNFNRATQITVTSDAFVDVAWAGVSHRFGLRAKAVMQLEPWRTHRLA